MKNETFKINFDYQVKEATMEICIGANEKRKYGRKFLYGRFDCYVDYEADRWECLPKMVYYNLRIEDEDENEITLRPVNLERIKQYIENFFEEMDYEQWLVWGADEDKIRYYDDTPADPITL
jgi:hypothetical protein